MAFGPGFGAGFGTGFARAQTGELVEVPDVVGETEADATTALESAGFAVSVTFANSSTVASGIVLAQNPAASTQAPSGSTVQITVSLGAASADTGLFARRGTGLRTIGVGRVRNRRTSLGLMKYTALVSAPVDLGEVAEDGTSDPLVIPGGARLAMSHSEALDAGVVTIGGFSHPALSANALHRGNFFETGKSIVVERGSAPAGTFTVYVLDLSNKPHAIATVTFS
jgi:hypothetical protein